MRASLLCCFLLLAVRAGAADYWPLTDGAVYTYLRTDGEFQTIEYSTSGTGDNICMRLNYPDGHFKTACYLETDGDVLIEQASANGGIDGEYWLLAPPALFLDPPLDVGDVWADGILGSSGWSQPPSVIGGEVDGTEDVVVPAGSFSTLIVTFWSSGGFYPPLGTWYLDRDIGPVILPDGSQLVSYEGVVATEQTTWSTIKAQYR